MIYPVSLAIVFVASAVLVYAVLVYAAKPKGESFYRDPAKTCGGRKGKRYD
jgi:hypothetical protein